jgi:hypothetical protein
VRFFVVGMLGLPEQLNKLNKRVKIIAKALAEFEVDTSGVADAIGYLDFSGMENSICDVAIALQDLASGTFYTDVLYQQLCTRLSDVTYGSRYGKPGTFSTYRARQQEQSSKHHLEFTVIPTPTVSQREMDMDMENERIFVNPAQYALLRSIPDIAIKRWFINHEPSKLSPPWYAMVDTGDDDTTLHVENVSLTLSFDVARLTFVVRTDRPIEKYLGEYPCDLAVAHVSRSCPHPRKCNRDRIQCATCKRPFACFACKSAYPTDTCTECRDKAEVEVACRQEREREVHDTLREQGFVVAAPLLQRKRLREPISVVPHVEPLIDPE